MALHLVVPAKGSKVLNMSADLLFKFVGPGPRRLAVSRTPALFPGSAKDDLHPS